MAPVAENGNKKAVAASPETEHPRKAFGLAARDSSGELTPFHFSRRNNGDDDVTLKIHYCGICHSDLHCVKNEWGNTIYPLVPGHEIVGIVTEVGQNVTKFKVGDKAGVGCLVGSCRSCGSCEQNLENYCPKLIFTYGSLNTDGTKTYGGYSDMIVVNEHYVVKYPENLPMDKGAPLLCAGITVYSPMKQFGLDEPGKHLGVVGLGGLGHVAVKFGKAFGMRVTVISSSPKKEKEAIEKLGADAFLVSSNPEQMQVNLKYEDDRPVDGKGIGRKVIDKLHKTYGTELGNKDFAYDGEKSLFTIGALPQVNNEFTVVLEDISSNKSAARNGSPGGNDSPGESDRKRLRRPYQTKTYKVELSYASKIPMQALASALKGIDSEMSQEALRVLDIILRQNAAKRNCLLVRQSFFQDNPSNFTDLGGGVLGCRGVHSSFRTSQGGLSLNIDVSTTMIVRPGPVVEFLIANQNVRDPYQIDWAKAKRMLKNLRVKVSPSNNEYKIVGLSEQPCNQQM